MEEKIEELNGMELLKLIYEEVKNNRKDNNEKFNIIENQLNEHDKKIEEINNKINQIEKKIDFNFKYLDEKINNTKNMLVTEISEEFKSFSTMTEESIKDLENKIDNEREERNIEILKIKDFNKIIINDIRSRVSILEEENEKYNLN